MRRLVAPALLVISLVLLATATAEEPKPEIPAIERIRTTVEGLGYETKELDPGVRYEIPVERSGITVYVTFVLSSNQQYLWFSSFLGDAPKADEQGAPKLLALLKQTAKTQPGHFYVTESDQLRYGYAIESRDLTPVRMRKTIDIVAEDVVAARPIWGD
ncbi:MAG: hypothetical protein HC813_01890 [Planctomycetes bacterium]|nr:hypothetical protein [Planctomycetota bacterium]